jgi:hypothetical protein
MMMVVPSWPLDPRIAMFLAPKIMHRARCLLSGSSQVHYLGCSIDRPWLMRYVCLEAPC